MSQFGGAGKNPPWMRATELPLTGSAMLAQAGASLASALTQPQTAVQQQQTQPFGTNLAALGLAQNALQATTVLSQAGLGLSAASLAASGGASLGYGTTQAAAARLLGAAAATTGVTTPSTKQRVFTGTVTKLHDNFGFVDEDVFFQTCVIKGTMPKVGERVLVEASYNPNMPFKWNAYRIQLLANQMNASVGVRLNSQITPSSQSNTSAAMAAQTQYINSLTSENKSSRSDVEKISYSQLLERTESRHRAEYSSSNTRTPNRRSSPSRRDRDMRHDDRRDRYRDRNSSRDFDKDRRPYDRNQDRASDRSSDRNQDRMQERDRVQDRDRLQDRDRDRIMDRDRIQDRLPDRVQDRNSFRIGHSGRSPIRDLRSRDRDRDRERDRDLRGPAQSPDRDYRGPGQDHDGSSTSSLARKHPLSPPRRGGGGSPPRRKPRMMPRYVVDIPAVCLEQRELGVVDLRKRYPNMYIPSDFFHAYICWQECFPLHRPFGLNYPCCFQVLPKDTCPSPPSLLSATHLESPLPPAVLDPSDIDFSFSAKVMLLSSPSLEELYQQTCALAEDESRLGTAMHPARVLSFLVGLKGKSETVAIGGPWSPSLDGPNPDSDPQTLIRTAVRTCRALTGIDLSACTQWYRFAEICYRRENASPNGAKVPTATLEKVVLFFPDVWRCMPTRQEWADLELRLRNADTAADDSATAGDAAAPSKEEENAAEETSVKEPTHYADLDPKTMKVGDLRVELELRGLSTKGLKSQLVARLSKALKAEAEMAEGNEEEEEEEEAEEEVEEEEVEGEDPVEEAVLDEVKEEAGDELKEGEDTDRPEEEKEALGEAEEKQAESVDVAKEEAMDGAKDEAMEKATKPPPNIGKPLRLEDLPSQPSILVYPSRTAKGGRFDCSVMSLSLLLDYRQEDNKEHSFEVSLFAELFNEMLIRDFGFNIYRALLEAPEQKEEKKKDGVKVESDKKSDRRDDRKSDRRRDRKDDEKKTDDQDESDAASEQSDGEGDSEENKEKRARKENRPQQQRTLQRHLLLSFIYFDQNQCGYLQDRDLEDIFYIIGLELSRGQVRRLLQKVSKRETVRYRSLTDAPVCPEDIVEEAPVADQEMVDEDEVPGDEQPSEQDLQIIAMGNRGLLLKSEDGLQESNATDPSTALESAGVAGAKLVFHDGALLDVGKLLRQVERSERARTSSETRLKELIEALAEVRESWEASRQEVLKTQIDLDQARRQLVVVEDDLCSSRKAAQELRLALQNCRQHLQATLGSLETVLGRKEHRGDTKNDD
ncbi:cell division cycle and apoptosis regulator protein 1-like isoform X1 [Dermacentor andersoni]|uniref:cell division cycle and apoptosis regulator protein 1-like isoform X1 n=1 Tax=Dermacentor andersoni TaxID=34620 RepID=UPI002155E579|nr:cell division cycle and apoptosis regulator protein 1-like isoform X1 [Dermacentor andersoni]XP_054918771.1 cell division cycle and apoptosis regulator protein 1-like isoform X1 [Dermacentor andersoni]XP_054918772.1 cell division cycle and apoptosis regulator protein 1-like isoform X1 [Dermacentor andersoni]